MTSWTAAYLRKTRAQIEANHKVFSDRYDKAKEHVNSGKELLVSYAAHLAASVADAAIQMKDIDAALRILDPCPACGGKMANAQGVECGRCEGLGYEERENG